MPCILTEFEKKQLGYQPRPVRTLLVGESRPANGSYFYYGNSRLVRYTCEALGGTADVDGRYLGFLEEFKARGFYLRDLCREPVNHLSRCERSAARSAGIEPLSVRIGQDRPEAVVVVMKGIGAHVRAAVDMSGLNVPVHNLPFPAMGHERSYVEQLRRLAVTLPQNSL